MFAPQPQPMSSTTLLGRHDAPRRAASASLLELRLLEVVGAVEDPARVVHPLVEPEAEELVVDVVRDLRRRACVEPI